MRRVAALVPVLVALALPAAAHAAYDPQFSMAVDPATPGAPAAITATVTQASGESATASQRVHFPPSFGFNPGFDVPLCPGTARDAQSCPESSAIGSASVQTSFGPFAGSVHLTESYELVVFLRGAGGLVETKVTGRFELHPDGSVETVMDGLPDVQSTHARIALMGGSKATLLTPRTCGVHTVRAVFESHEQERAERNAPITIAGCDTRPRFVIANATPSKVRRRAPRTTLSWRLREAGSATAISIRRVSRSGRFERAREVLSLRAGASEGINRATADLRRKGKALPAGDYLAHLTALSAQGRASDAAEVRFRIVR